MQTICHIVYECTPGRFAGGVQKVVYELAVAQVRRGDFVEIWTLGDLPDHSDSSGLRIRYFKGSRVWSSRAMWECLVAENNRFDIIHAHNTFLALNRYAADLARRFKSRVFFHAHGALDPQLLSGFSLKAVKKRLYVGLFEKRNYASAKGIIALTRSECEQITALGIKTPVFEVGNGITMQPPATTFAAAAFRLKHRIPVDRPVVLFVGRITHKKGLHYLIDAMPRVLECVPSVRLVICGGRGQDVEYVRQLDEQVSLLGLVDCVRWAGFVDEIEKRSAFASSSVFAHPSYSEGMALAILEAMAFGIPTVVTPGCYMDVAVASGALELTQQNAHRLADTLITLLSNQARARETSEKGRIYARDNHTWEAVASRLSKIYAGDSSCAPFNK